MNKLRLGLSFLLFISIACAQDQSPAEKPHDMSDMPGMQQTQTAPEEQAADSDKETPEKNESEKPATIPAVPETPAVGAGSATAMHSMESHHVDMGPHMKMTSLRELKPGDQEKADRVLEAARAVAAKYQNYKDALSDGYKIFLPNLPQKQYHFTNYWYGYEAGVHFNPEHPTSLLYEKHGDDYKLVGVMYTASKRASEEDLNSRVPLSISQWHAHVNLCLAPQGKKSRNMSSHPQFGLGGSITTQDACDTAGGKFIPQIFGWMVHVYPLEQKPEEIWSAARQAHSHMD